MKSLNIICTRTICRSAYGAVLFIDEAYSLYSSGDSQDYGKEVLSKLISEMENNRDKLVVILVGYEIDMDKMLSMNRGLRDRIAHKIQFQNYSREELIKIFFNLMDPKIAYDKAFKKAIEKYFNSITDDQLNNENFSNARFVRNFYERIFSKASVRVQFNENESDFNFKASDVENASLERDFAGLLSKTRNKKIGFN